LLKVGDKDNPFSILGIRHSFTNKKLAHVEC
jgi:hypothetical protein